MRYDYLTRFKNQFGNKGFNRLLKKGTSFESAYFSHIPTYTEVGHAAIYTGTTPKNNGIIGNNWYDKFLKKSIYVVDDNRYKTVGSASKNGQKSPYRLVASTLADELKITQNFNGKTIGVAIKDRSSILPVGHTANAAYWFDGDTIGNWITSSYYTKKQKKWVATYNKHNKKQLDTYIHTPWATLNNSKNYVECAADHDKYERKHKNESKASFPHQIEKLEKNNGHYSILKATPFGNTMTLNFAKQIVKHEKLGQNKIYSDFLAISLSSTDYIGHQYGPASTEIEDTYVRLNNDLDNFINYLDKHVGSKKYVLFLTADHAVVNVPQYLIDNKAPGDYFSSKKLLAQLNKVLFQKFNSNQLIENISNNQIFLNKQNILKHKLSFSNIEETLMDTLLTNKYIYKVVSAKTLQKNEFRKAPLSLLQEGYNQKLSGDLLFTLKPTIISDGYLKGGTTHGTGYIYDTHVPLIFYGNGIAKGKTVKKTVTITQIAPTLANILKIQEPNMSSTKIVTEVFK